MGWYSTRMRRLLVALALAAPGCSHEDAGHRRLDPIVVAPHDAGPVTPRATLGVPVCDAYLDDFARCIHKMDRAAQPAARKLLDDTRRAWSQSARSVEGNVVLSQACKLASDAARAATAGMGCGF
jgi:hypothetical protein